MDNLFKTTSNVSGSISFVVLEDYEVNSYFE
jgi:hypothetical protein